MPACRAKYKHTTSSMCTTRTMHRAQPAVYRKHHARLVKCQPTVGGRTVGMSTRQQNNPATAQQATHQAWPHNYCLKYTSLAAGARMHASRNTQHAACSTDTPTAARAATAGIQTPQICTARGDGDEAQSARTATEVRHHNPKGLVPVAAAYSQADATETLELSDKTARHPHASLHPLV